MIGGTDISFAGQFDSDSLQRMLGVVLAVWENAVVELGDSTIIFEIDDAVKRSWTLPCELFVYDSREIYKSWTAEGLTDLNAGQMVSITIDEGSVSFVVSETSSEAGRLVQDIVQTFASVAER